LRGRGVFFFCRAARCTAISALLRLVLWHALQPALYAYVFSHAFPTLEPLQRWLGGFVLLREALYLLFVVACAWVNPAFLLVDVAASVRDEGARGEQGGNTFLAMYVLAPEKYVATALFYSGGLDKEGLVFPVVVFLGPLLNPPLLELDPSASVFLCKPDWHHADGSCFHLPAFEDPAEWKTWPAAEAACQELGGNLASIRSEAQHDVVKALLAEAEGFGQYRWVNGNVYSGQFYDGMKHG
jgi:hypothetical protein